MDKSRKNRYTIKFAKPAELQREFWLLVSREIWLQVDGLGSPRKIGLKKNSSFS